MTHDHELTRSRRRGTPATAAEEPAVEVRGLRKAYGDAAGARRRRPRRSAAARCSPLLGPNGAGKTTLVEILEGHRTRRRRRGPRARLRPRASASARSASASASCCRRPGSTRRSRVREAVELYSAAYPNPRPADEVLELVGLADRADDRAPTLSGGQRRRLDLALGIAGDPELIFLDEPTTGFDPAARRQSWELIAGLRDARQDDPADDALHGRGAAPGRPRRRDRARPHHRRGHAGHARPRRRATPSSFRVPTASSDAAAARRRERRARRPSRFRTARPTRDLAPLLAWAADARHRARGPDRHPPDASRTSTSQLTEEPA